MEQSNKYINSLIQERIKKNASDKYITKSSIMNINYSLLIILT